MKVTAKWISLKFEKLRGDNPYAKSWDEIPSDWQSSMLEAVHFDSDEAPVCAITASPNPVVITTKRMIWRSDAATTQHLLFSELASVEAPEFFHKSKLDISKLIITTRSGQEHSILTEPGTTLFVLWNLLLKFTARNRTDVSRSQ